ncbi:hypothetical protein [Streptomyces sp. V2I9]|uniref:hypothetical protein n=1 Tax=Streptomyces sp. V2I9 TaxID=3042304 RepID=UPI0027826D1C|nr:hypothetical protein [Streptomyces sp. V2I9]MDQ0988316.1 hypothetical protein [Streptomyces sp. V2I9]
MAGTTPLGAVARGALAGAAGTLAMDALLYLRYRRGGGGEGFGPWETAAAVRDWNDAPAPAQVGRRLVEGLFRRELDPRWARSANNATHWAYGMLAGAQYGLVVGSVARPRIGYGVLLGAGLWGAGYVVLPAAGLYRPITEYDRVTLARDLGAHLLYGVTTAAVFAALGPGRSSCRAG